MSDSKTPNTLYSTFLTYVKENKLRDTYERRTIIELIEECDGPFTSEYILTQLRAKNSNISRATLYNTLALLIKAKLVRRKQFSDRQTLYECSLRLPAGNQLYLVCTTCGKVATIRKNTIIKELNKLNFGTFTADYISFTVYGTCSRCARIKRKEMSTEARQLKLFN